MRRHFCRIGLQAESHTQICQVCDFFAFLRIYKRTRRLWCVFHKSTDGIPLFGMYLALPLLLL